MAPLAGICELRGHTDRAWHVAWSPSGEQLASCSSDKTVRIWSRIQGGDSWTCSAILEEAHTRTIRACSWSPSGRYLATASFDATTAIWELQGGVWEQVTPAACRMHACMHNVWPMPVCAIKVATLEGHENEVKCVAWSPDGSHISTCGRDKSVWVWESIPGNEYECVDVKHGHSQVLWEHLPEPLHLGHINLNHCTWGTST